MNNDHHQKKPEGKETVSWFISNIDAALSFGFAAENVAYRIEQGYFHEDLVHIWSFNDEDLEKIANALLRNQDTQPIKRLVLQNTAITDRGAEHITRLILGSTVLEIIDIYSDCLSIAGMIRMTAAVFERRSQGRSFIHLRGPGTVAMSHALQRAPTDFNSPQLYQRPLHWFAAVAPLDPIQVPVPNDEEDGLVKRNRRLL